MESNARPAVPAKLIGLSRLDDLLHRLAEKSPRWLGVVDAGATRWDGSRWFGLWIERSTDCAGVLHRSWVVRLGHTEVTVDFRPVKA
jgi:hypothetical protein